MVRARPLRNPFRHPRPPRLGELGCAIFCSGLILLVLWLSSLVDAGPTL